MIASFSSYPQHHLKQSGRTWSCVLCVSLHVARTVMLQHRQFQIPSAYLSDKGMNGSLARRLPQQRHGTHTHTQHTDTHRHTDTQTHRHTQTQTETHRHTHTHMHTCHIHFLKGRTTNSRNKATLAICQIAFQEKKATSKRSAHRSGLYDVGLRILGH